MKHKTCQNCYILLARLLRVTIYSNSSIFDKLGARDE